MLAHTYCVMDLVTNMQKKLYRKEIGKFGKQFTLLVCRALKEFNCQKAYKECLFFHATETKFCSVLSLFA